MSAPNRTSEEIDDPEAAVLHEAFWTEVHMSFARLRSNPEAWQAYQAEVAALEGGSMDGLEHEEAYYTKDEEESIRMRAPGK